MLVLAAILLALQLNLLTWAMQVEITTLKVPLISLIEVERCRSFLEVTTCDYSITRDTLRKETKAVYRPDCADLEEQSEYSHTCSTLSTRNSVRTYSIKDKIITKFNHLEGTMELFNDWVKVNYGVSRLNNTLYLVSDLPGPTCEIDYIENCEIIGPNRILCHDSKRFLELRNSTGYCHNFPVLLSSSNERVMITNFGTANATNRPETEQGLIKYNHAYSYANFVKVTKSIRELYSLLGKEASVEVKEIENQGISELNETMESPKFFPNHFEIKRATHDKVSEFSEFLEIVGHKTWTLASKIMNFFVKYLLYGICFAMIPGIMLVLFWVVALIRAPKKGVRTETPLEIPQEVVCSDQLYPTEEVIVYRDY